MRVCFNPDRVGFVCLPGCYKEWGRLNVEVQDARCYRVLLCVRLYVPVFAGKAGPELGKPAPRNRITMLALVLYKQTQHDYEDAERNGDLVQGASPGGFFPTKRS